MQIKFLGLIVSFVCMMIARSASVDPCAKLAVTNNGKLIKIFLDNKVVKAVKVDQHTTLSELRHCLS